MSEDPTVLEVVNSTPIDGDLLADVYASEASMLAGEHKRPELRRARLVELLQELGENDDRLRALVASIEFRQVALDRLIRDGGAHGFAGPAPREGMSRVHRDLFRCAGEEPLVRVGEEVRFDTTSFQRRLLNFTDVQGNA